MKEFSTCPISGQAIMNPANSRAVRIEIDQMLPAATDAIVIGGGILEGSLPTFLAQRGIAVALYERGIIDGESSSRAPGQGSSAGFGARKMGRWLNPSGSEVCCLTRSEVIQVSAEMVTSHPVTVQSPSSIYK